MLSNRRYTVLAKQSIDIWCDSVGVSKLQDDIADILAEDVTYRLREVVHNAMESMKNSRRTCLTVDDMNFAFNETNSETIYGHGGPDIVSFKSIPIQDQQICYIDEKDVNLRDMALDSNHPEPTPEMTLKVNWSVIEGKSLTSSSAAAVVSDKDASENKALKLYLELILRSVHEQNEDNLKLLYKDLRSNKNMKPIITRMLLYFSDQIVKKTHSNEHLGCVISSFCSIVASLLENESIFISMHMAQIMSILQHAVTSSDLPVSDWSVVQKAALLLACICRSHIDTASEHTNSIIKSYSTFLSASDSSLSQLFGAVTGLDCLGVEAIIPSYSILLKRLESLACENVGDLKSVTTSHAIFLCLLTLMRERCERRNSFCNKLYRNLHSYYGDCLTTCVIHNWRSFRGCTDTNGNNVTSLQKVEKTLNLLPEFVINKDGCMSTCEKVSADSENRKIGLPFHLNKRKMLSTPLRFFTNDDADIPVKKKKLNYSTRKNVKRFYRTSMYMETRRALESRWRSPDNIRVLFL